LTLRAGRLDEIALLAVHDNLVTCAQQHDELGLVAHVSGEQVISDSEVLGVASTTTTSRHRRPPSRSRVRARSSSDCGPTRAIVAPPPTSTS
jgi:hypothetical protein